MVISLQIQEGIWC